MNVEQDEEPEEDGMPIAAENWPSLKLFLDLGTQWRVVATIRRLVWSAILFNASNEMPLVNAASPARAITFSLPPARSRATAIPKAAESAVPAWPAP